MCVSDRTQRRWGKAVSCQGQNDLCFTHGLLLTAPLGKFPSTDAHIAFTMNRDALPFPDLEMASYKLRVREMTSSAHWDGFTRVAAVTQVRSNKSPCGLSFDAVVYHLLEYPQ